MDYFHSVVLLLLCYVVTNPQTHLDFPQRGQGGHTGIKLSNKLTGSQKKQTVKQRDKQVGGEEPNQSDRCWVLMTRSPDVSDSMAD